MQTRELLFFLLLGLAYMLGFKVSDYMMVHIPKKHRNVVYAGLSLVLVSLSFLVYESFGICENSEKFTVSPEKMCKGGAYMHQGDDPKSRMCREMMESEEGRALIQQAKCPLGNVGLKGRPFEYTPLSDSNWRNARCQT